jgi:signal transduction histidine kinase
MVKSKAAARSQADIVDLIHEVLRLLEPDLRQSEARVELHADDSRRLARVDEIQIQQVLVNLIRNALDAMREVERGGRTLAIRTARGDGDLIEIAVCDSGVGIPLESRNEVFEPFYSTKSEGMGMGLAISRTIVAAHGGDLWMTPNPGRGTTFHFTVRSA